MLKIKFWSFSGKDEEGKSIRGIIDAQNKAIAHYKLLKMGLKRINHLILTFTSYKKQFNLNDKEKLHLFSNLSMQINAGLSILECIQSLKLDATSFKVKYLLFNILNNLNEGYRLSFCFEKLAYNPFSSTEIGLIKSSEMSGNLEATLQFMCEKLENKITIKQKLISAFIYPSITLLVSLFVTYIIFKWVIPQFASIFSQNKQALPWLTEIIFSISRNIEIIFLIFLTSVTISFIAIKLAIKYQWFSVKLMEKMFLKIPVMGETLTRVNRIDFCYTISMLLGAGVSLHDALSEAIASVRLPYSRECLQRAFNELMFGKALSTTLKKTSFFSRSAIQTIASAEKTGHLDQAFKCIGQQCSQDLSIFSDHVGKVIEPFIIVILGSIIGAIVIAIYLPIFQLGSLY